MTNHVDQVVGRITDQLYALDLDRKTVLLFTTDNGCIEALHHVSCDGFDPRQ